MAFISQIDVRFLCVCPVIDDDICHNIVKVAVEWQGTAPSGCTAILVTLWWNHHQ